MGSLLRDVAGPGDSEVDIVQGGRNQGDVRDRGVVAIPQGQRPD
ncbi:hypothetical protein ACQXX3_10170 [Corynebacterium diphtheriae]